MAKKLNDIDPDGLRIVIPWETLQVGDSFFVLCIRKDFCERQVNEIAKRLGVTLTARHRVEPQGLGLRFWRTA